jgi:hypothetical protein
MKPKQWKAAKPFVGAALFWGVIGSVWVILVSPEATRALAWMLGLWVICLFDLVALAKMFDAVLSLAARGVKTAWMVQAFFWTAAKLACIAVVIAVLIAGKDAPQLGLILGSSTLVVVPLVGGLWWSRTQLSMRSRVKRTSRN